MKSSQFYESRATGLICVKLSESILNIPDFAVSVQKCQETEPCVKMSENGSKNVSIFSGFKYNEMTEKNSIFSNYENLINIGVSTIF